MQVWLPTSACEGQREGLHLALGDARTIAVDHFVASGLCATIDREVRLCRRPPPPCLRGPVGLRPVRGRWLLIRAVSTPKFHLPGKHGIVSMGAPRREAGRDFIGAPLCETCPGPAACALAAIRGLKGSKPGLRNCG